MGNENIQKICQRYEERLKWTIQEMMTEEAANHFPDPADEYDRKRKKKRSLNLETGRELMTFIHADKTGKPDDIIVLYDLYHYLIRNLTIDKNSWYLEKQLREFSSSGPMKYRGWFTRIRAFLKEKLNVPFKTENTAYHPNMLSRIIQYSIFEWGQESSQYIILQVHHGRDIYKGYGVPRIFKIIDIVDFYYTQVFIKATCTGILHDPCQTCINGIDVAEKCNNWWITFDAGTNYNFLATSPEVKPIEDNTRYDKDTQKLFCKDCGGEIVFSPGDHG
jgi:hypothetical protein